MRLWVSPVRPRAFVHPRTVMSKTPPRILAIDPGTRYMGVAVLDGPRLLYYGVKTFRERRPVDGLLQATRKAVLGLIVDYRPTVLAYEKTFYVQSQNSALLQAQEAEIARLGRGRGLRVVGYLPSHVRRLLCGYGRATKDDVADVLAARFPELGEYRRSNDAVRERYWSNMFDAVAVAVVCADERDAAVQAAAAA